jgi:hypothetical protein
MQYRDRVNGRTFVELIGILAGCGLLIGAFSMTTSLGLAILVPTVLIALLLVRRQALVPSQLRAP